jgi:hypothetical protein
LAVTIARTPAAMSTSTRSRSRAGQRSSSSWAMRLPSACPMFWKISCVAASRRSPAHGSASAAHSSAARTFS